MASPFKTKLVTIAGWLAPSVVAAAGGAVITGVVEVRADVERVLIAIGVIAPIAFPVLLLASVLARALYAAWLPEALAGTLREERGAMPRLAAWVGVAWLGVFGLAWVIFQGIWRLASWTAFKPGSMSFLAPILAVLALWICVALSRPAAELFAIVARWIDRQWQRRMRGTLLSPTVIFVGAAITACGAGYVIWIVLVNKRMPQLSGAFLLGAVAGVLTTIALHAAWRGPRWVRAGGGAVIGAAFLGTVILGLREVTAEPHTAIAIWAESRLGRLGLEKVSDVERVREHLPPDRAKPIARGTAHPDVVLVTVDGLRADRTPPYHGPAAMPALADLARRGTLFAWAFATSTTERRTIPSLVTGIAPHRIRGDGSEDGFDLDPRHIALAERLRAGGYETAAFTCCFEAAAERTWLRGFTHRASDPDPVQLGGAARAWLGSRTRTQPLFVWLHVAVPIDREVAAEQRLAAYDAALATVDRGLGELIAALSSRTAERTPIVIVAGTRGEELGEHGAAFSTDDLFNTQLRVPLVIAGPTIRVTRASDAVSISDVAPTIIELAGFAPPRSSSDGISLAPLLTGQRVSMANLAFAAILPDRGQTLNAMMLVRGHWKLIDGGGAVELYDLRTDPDERTNLAHQRMQTVTELRALLTGRIRAGQVSPF